MQVSDDLELSSKTPGKAGEQVLDLILSEKEGGRRLLVRVLHAGSSPNEAAACRDAVRLEQYSSKLGKTETTGKRLVLPLVSTTAIYKILLLAYRQAEPLPRTTWNEDMTRIEVAWPGQTDRFTFSKGGDGRARFVIQRAGQNLLEVK